MTDILGVIEAACLLEIHPVTLRRLAKDGRIPGRKVGRAWKFSRPALVSFVGQIPPTAPSMQVSRSAPGRETINTMAASIINAHQRGNKRNKRDN